MGWGEEGEWDDVLQRVLDDKYIDHRRQDIYLCRLRRLLPYRDEKTTWKGLFGLDRTVSS
jgi:hypothetical protein